MCNEASRTLELLWENLTNDGQMRDREVRDVNPDFTRIRAEPAQRL